jgi:hypothetical protein|tara:strand:+ start:81 stop:494 length:414 start_codon:yes stop_codon:yes gene_type:complete
MKKEYRYSDLVAFLKKKHIEPEEAIDICKRATEVNPTNHRTRWKMYRFTMYLWARIDEDKKGLLGKKIETIRRVVGSQPYKNMYKTFPFGSFNPEKEIDKLNKLISDPRQYPIFKSHNFVYKGTNRNIPQETINKIR